MLSVKLPGKLVAAMVACFFFVIAVPSVVLAFQYGQSANFPASPNNGLQITYQLNGATILKEDIDSGNTPVLRWSNGSLDNYGSLQFSGKATGTKVALTDFTGRPTTYEYFEVYFYVGGKLVPTRLTPISASQDAIPFNITVPLPAPGGGVSVYMELVGWILIESITRGKKF